MTTPRRMPEILSFSKVALLLLPILLSACAHQRYDKQFEKHNHQIQQLEQQLRILQGEVKRLNARHGDEVNLPQQDKETMMRKIQQLKDRRSQLLKDLTPAHPSIVKIDRHIEILQKRIQAINRDQPNRVNNR